MKVLLFGATGMVGQAALRECLAAPDVSQVTVVGRTSVDQVHTKLQQLILADLTALHEHENDLQKFDACFFCLGVSSSGMTEDAYRRVTYDLTLAVASLLAQANPDMTFVYVSGAGTDSTEQGRSMWARVKGKTENDLQKLSLRSVYLFRPGVIQPLHGIRSKTPSYKLIYALANPLLSLIRLVSPGLILTTEDIGRAMLNAARQHNARVVVEASDLMRLSKSAAV